MSCRDDLVQGTVASNINLMNNEGERREGVFVRLALPDGMFEYCIVGHFQEV